jgi:hypothetical protein
MPKVIIINIGLGIPQYYKIIKKPMWLKKVEEKFNKNEYKNCDQIFGDINLIWDNCMKFNQEQSLIYKTSMVMAKETKELIRKYKKEIAKENKFLGKKRKSNNTPENEKKQKSDTEKEEENKVVMDSQWYIFSKIV